MIQIYADGVLAYDSRLQERGKDYTLLGLTTTTSENKGGTATIIMPPHHPAYSLFVSHRTIVEMYRDGRMDFRGRALIPSDDMFNRRTWTIEGELCLFQDGLARPYLYHDSPAAIFTAVVNEYNSQVEDFKRFRVGTITVTDPNDYVRLESESAEQSLTVINKLLERCGGYIAFTTDTEGRRVINWYASTGYRSNQTIEFGENLLDFAREGINTDLATVLVPYGAKDETTGVYVDITSVNNGLDYIVDEEARAIRGWIARPAYYDDITIPANLLKKARADLEVRKKIVTALRLSALDLSRLGTTRIDSFQVGDTVRVKSRPHEVDEDFRLTEYTEDWLHPDLSTISLGKEQSFLTSADVAGDNKSLSELQRTKHQIEASYTLNIANAVAEAERLLTSLIQQTSESLKLEVSETYTTNDKLTEAISTSMTQLSDSFTFAFDSLKVTVDETEAYAREQITEIYKYIRFIDGDIVLGASDSGITLTLENDLIVFKKNGVQFGWWDGTNFHTGNIVVEVEERAQFGNFAAIPRRKGNLSWLKVK